VLYHNSNIEDNSDPPVGGGIDPEFDRRWRGRLGKNGAADVFVELFAPLCDIAKDSIQWGFSYKV
jgi:hypothetical protein